MTAGSIVEAKGLCVRYGAYEALSGIDFSIAPGDFLAIVGANGSGKSTLLRAMLGLIGPSSGSILLYGEVPERALRAHPVGYLPQKSTHSDFRFPATVREVVASGTARGDREGVARAMELLRVADLADLRVGTLSGGQQQRVHLARALARRPGLVLLDEPTGALDPDSRECFYATLEELNSSGISIVIVSHDLVAVSRSARKVLYIDRVALYFGDIADFRERAPAHYFGGSGGHGHDHQHDHPHEHPHDHDHPHDRRESP